MTPYSFHISKFKVLSEGDGMVDTQFGNYPLAAPSIEISFIEILLEDLTPEQAKEIKTNLVLLLNFNDYELDVPLKHYKEEEDDSKTVVLSSKEPVEAHVVEILDNSNLSEGSVLLKVECIHEFSV